MEILYIIAILFSVALLAYYKKRPLLDKGTVLDALHDGVLLLDRKGKILFSNAMAQEMLGITKQDKHLKDEGALEEICLSVAKSALSSKKRKTDLFMTDIPHFQSYQVSATVIPRGRALLVLNDRTSTDRMQVMGKNFVANASHELRTPITIIRGFAEMLGEASEISSDMLEGIVDKILRNCARMSTLVKNLITLADLDNKNIKNKYLVDLISLLDGCHYTVLTVHPEATIELLHNVGAAEIEGDPDMLELAFLNLLENAVKYSAKPAEITTKIEQKEGEIAISICDKGKGIPAEDLPHIFERFYTVDKTHSRKLGGAGLGLSIVHKIVKLHGFTIRAESEEGKGTTFIITAPLALQ